MMEEEMYVSLSAINAYSYCPYRMYLEYVQGEWENNVHTIEGILRHERAHSGEKRYDKNKKQATQVFVKSDKYRLVGKIDVVEEKLREIYPVEYKKGRAGKWINDYLQLCAQALCLEEQMGIRIDKGYLWYFGSRDREEVIFDDNLRKATIKASHKILNIMNGKFTPKNKHSNRCRACSMERVCLPTEVGMLRVDD
jgi:CRISPR-associated exonuclease Cas4